MGDLSHFDQQGPRRSVPLVTPRSRGRATYAQLADEYLDRILIGDRRGAVRLLVEEVEHGADAAALVSEVVDVACTHLRRRALAGSISVDQRRHGETVTDLAMSLLQPPVFNDIPGRMDEK